MKKQLMYMETIPTSHYTIVVYVISYARSLIRQCCQKYHGTIEVTKFTNANFYKIVILAYQYALTYVMSNSG
jgi:hypothetical protein